jgi:hypothetical protein
VQRGQRRLRLPARPAVLAARINTVEDFGALLAWADAARAGEAIQLPPGLEPRAFAWTGGGPGPVPPIEP